MPNFRKLVYMINESNVVVLDSVFYYVGVFVIIFGCKSRLKSDGRMNNRLLVRFVITKSARYGLSRVE